MTVYIVTLYNKPDYFEMAAASVKAQTRECIHLAQRDVYQTAGLYPPAVYFNNVVKDLSTDSYIAWLSDDDLLLPNYVADLAGYLDVHPEVQAVYGLSEHVMFDITTGQSSHIRMLPNIGGCPVFNAALSPWCRLDGGQFMHRRSALDMIAYPWYPESQEGCSVCDGTFATKVANACGIHPLTPMKQVMVNRATPRSSHTVLSGGRIVAGNWVLQRAVPTSWGRMFKPEDVTLIVVEFNTLALTRHCLESLVAFYPDIKMVLVDNGSTDGSVQYLRAVANVRGSTVLLNRNNIGHGPGMHQALQYCKTKYALMLDSDSVVMKGGWIERMMDIALHDDKVYAVGAILYVDDAGDVRDTGYEYVHPARMLIDVDKYKLLASFNAHGAPCVMNMRDADAHAFILAQMAGLTVNGDDCVKHIRGGTHSMLKSIPGWGGEGHLARDAVSAKVMIASTATEVVNG